MLGRDTRAPRHRSRSSMLRCLQTRLLHAERRAAKRSNRAPVQAAAVHTAPTPSATSPRALLHCTIPRPPTVTPLLVPEHRTHCRVRPRKASDSTAALKRCAASYAASSGGAGMRSSSFLRVVVLVLACAGKRAVACQAAGCSHARWDALRHAGRHAALPSKHEPHRAGAEDARARDHEAYAAHTCTCARVHDPARTQCKAHASAPARGWP